MSNPKVVLHISEADRWHAALGNLVNLTALDDQPEVRVVVNGSAVYALQGQHDWLDHMTKAAARGVTFQVCRNSLKAHDIPERALPDWASTVPNGVIALAEAQHQGFAYIKP
ncbi:MAG: DsrE family protein [Deinococcus sp.]|nr:DsrE family protein [Deinococcus sp.]